MHTTLGTKYLVLVALYNLVVIVVILFILTRFFFPLNLFLPLVGALGVIIVLPLALLDDFIMKMALAKYGLVTFPHSWIVSRRMRLYLTQSGLGLEPEQENFLVDGVLVHQLLFSDIQFIELTNLPMEEGLRSINHLIHTGLINPHTPRLKVDSTHHYYKIDYRRLVEQGFHTPFYLILYFPLVVVIVVGLTLLAMKGQPI